MDIFLYVGAVTLVYIFGFAWFLVVIGRLGALGQWIAGHCIAAPGLDIVVSLLTWVPWAVSSYLFGWGGLLGSLAGQIAGLTLWMWSHEWRHRHLMSGPRIVKSLNGIIGRTRNHLALWLSTTVLPAFWMIRLGEIIVYPLMRQLLGFPKYKDKEWVNVSRQKFTGLVGHDLIWCLYCDWMTGIYSYGAEMLRNVESFWCPIRFSDQNKCANCQIDFPDIKNGWVKADGTMADVVTEVEKKYTDKNHSWFGHPSRFPSPDTSQADDTNSTNTV